jgi:hypothetical protein
MRRRRFKIAWTTAPATFDWNAKTISGGSFGWQDRAREIFRCILNRDYIKTAFEMAGDIAVDESDV